MSCPAADIEFLRCYLRLRDGHSMRCISQNSSRAILLLCVARSHETSHQNVANENSKGNNSKSRLIPTAEYLTYTFDTRPCKATVQGEEALTTRIASGPIIYANHPTR